MPINMLRCLGGWLCRTFFDQPPDILASLYLLNCRIIKGNTVLLLQLGLQLYASKAVEIQIA